MKNRRDNMKDSQEQQQNEQMNSYADAQNMEAEVLGRLRKDKIGKPLLVIEIAALFALVFIALPIINNQLNDPNSTLSILINGAPPVVNVPKDNTEEFSDGGTAQALTASTKMKKFNIVMENFSLTEDSLKCNMYSYNGLLNLDEKEYYLEIYSSSDNLLAAIKLTGTFDATSTPVDLSINGLNFNTGYKYLGKIVEMNEELYPDVELSTDESGIGSFTCTLKEQRSITYTFKNNYLIKIDDQENVLLADYSSQEYLNKKKDFDTKKSNLGDIASVEENDTGFVFKATIDLEVPDYVVPESVLDYNYYKKDSLAKEINYALKGKGYDCK